MISYVQYIYVVQLRMYILVPTSIFYQTIYFSSRGGAGHENNSYLSISLLRIYVCT